MHFGDSHIAADILTAQIRRRFQEEFGDGGPGYIVPRNPMSTRRRGVTSGASNGWTIEGIGGHVAGDGIYAPAGIALATNLAYEKAWLQTSANHFEVYYVSQPGGGSIDVTVDGASVLDAPLSLVSRLPRLNYFSYDEPVADNYRVEVRTVAPGKVRVLGIVAERVNPGVSYDVLGINGARATRLLDWNAAAFAGVLTQRKPDLIILAFGTNEAGDPDWTAAAHQQVFTRILRRLHNAVPRASILIYGPPERADNPLAARRMRLVIESQRQAALAGNAAFWSSYDAMGGPGSMNAWITRGLGQADHVHLSGPGYVRMGDLFYEALMRAYRGGQ
ncbi:MAG: putative periplasmic protein [Acidobacteria bacterium]|nr:putative periplasmic protein [Acidobacteriota bacterium]